MNKKLKVFETFAGIGAQTKALKNIGVDHKVVAISEWNIDSIISYGWIHHTQKMIEFVLPSDAIILDTLSKFTFSSDGKVPYKNISRLKREKLYELYKAHTLSNNFSSILDVRGQNLPEIDLLTYSFPCQAISVCGKEEGLAKGTETSSSMLWEIERILLELKEINKLPSYLLMENVSALFNKKHVSYFILWIEFLATLGYKTKSTVLNATDFDIPQTRERAFAVSILNENVYDKSYDMNMFSFPSGERTVLRMFDILDKTVDENYYLDYLVDKIVQPQKNNVKIQDSGLHYTNLGNYSSYLMRNRAYFDDSLCPTLTANSDGMPKQIIQYNIDNKVYFDVSFSPTILASSHGKCPKMYDGVRLRNLTSKERLLLMGFSELDYKNLLLCPYKIADSSISMQAGNSIVVNVLEAIFKKLFLTDVKEEKTSDLWYNFS